MVVLGVAVVVLSWSSPFGSVLVFVGCSACGVVLMKHIGVVSGLVVVRGWLW